MTVWRKSESLCQKAREYYYELLRHNNASVPEAITRHVEGCSFCREQIRQLQEALAKAEKGPDSSQGPRNNEAIEALSRHFEFLGKPVRCAQVKPFLPELLISSRQIRIPTPITVHVENCPQCGRDLASIRELGLRASQLDRLGRFYNHAGDHSPSQCPASGSVAAGLAVFSLDGADSRRLDHVSLCPECRDWLYQQRAETMADRCVRDSRTGVLACCEISMADVFDFVVPYGLDMATIVKTNGRRDAVATHVRGCPQCLEKVQSLHQTLYAVAERADSGISTVCRTEEDGADAGGQVQADAHRYPIHVQVLQQEPAWAAVTHGLGAPGGFRRVAAVWKAVPRSRIALVAAAVLVAGVAMIPLSTATGMNVGGLQKAVGRMTNVCMTKSNGENSPPFFEMLVATDRQIVITTIGEEHTTVDFATRRRTVVRPGRPTYTGDLTPGDFGNCRELLVGAVGVIFDLVAKEDDLSEVGHVASDQPGESWRVYELTKESGKRNGAPFLHQWKVYFDPVRERPMRIEYSRQPSPGQSPTQVQVTKFTYLTQSAMDREITARSAAR